MPVAGVAAGRCCREEVSGDDELAYVEDACRCDVGTDVVAVAVAPDLVRIFAHKRGAAFQSIERSDHPADGIIDFDAEHACLVRHDCEDRTRNREIVDFSMLEFFDLIDAAQIVHAVDLDRTSNSFDELLC